MKLAYLRRFKKPLASILLVPFLMSIFPTSLLAITSGPAQEEFANFEPAQTTELVNLYTGDFTYNIPLLNVPGPNGGYPLNLFYNSGAGMNDAGSWVGLGWNLNIGSVSRQLRGLPDDFNGEEVKQEMHLRNNFAVGVDIPQRTSELFGRNVGNTPRWNAQIYYNNYKGLGYRVGTSFGIKGFGNVGVSYDAQNGIGVDPAITLGGKFKSISGSLTLSTAFNSRSGLRGVALQTSLNMTSKYTKTGKGVSKFAGGGSSSLSFGFNGSVPDINVPTRTTHIDFDLKFATGYQWPLFNVNRWGNWQGFAEWSKLVNGGSDSRKAYGYLYNQNAGNSDYKDFNRSNLEYSKKVPNLSPASYTYDPMIVTGAGVGGQFRPYRSKVEILNTPKQISKTDGHRANLELGLGMTLHLGLGYAYTNGEQYSGLWRDGIPSTFLNPNPSQTSNVAFQDAYYQLYGEQTGYLQSSANQLDSWLGEEPLRAVLDKNTNDYSMDDQGFFTNAKTGASLDADNYGATPTLGARQNRTPKANYFQTLTESEAYNFGFSKDLFFYKKNGSNYVPQDKFTTAPNETSGKISEVIVNKDDGYRYVYGLPACNTKQVDAVFNVYPPYTDVSTPPQNVDGDANTDIIAASGHTTKGVSNQYESKKTLPEYAHSWLLTHVLSADYQDRTGDGLTNDDPGSWMKFNYERTTGDNPNEKYKWREPYAGSNFMEGQKSNILDDMASYVYGEKDLFYLRTVETPTHVAVFETSNRDDARGVIDEPTGKRSTSATNAMKKLDRIKMYLKNSDGSYPDFSTATPLQTAVFVYADPIDELCKGIPSASSGRGKLTLKQVYLTTEYSTRGSLSPYRFDYGPNDAVHNPNFNRRNKDRWGFYQNNTGTYAGLDYPYIDFPYTDQYEEPNADAWQLKEITLPTGGKINVDYESDDYAYEMDKTAKQMFDIIHLGDTPNPNWPVIRNRLSNSNSPFGGSMTDTDSEGNYRVYVHLTTPIPTNGNGIGINEYFKRYYLDQIDKLYYKVFAGLIGNEDETSDYISGYADLLKGAGQYGVVTYPGSDNTIAFLTLKKVPIQKPSFGENIHPFRKGALQFLKLHRNELVTGYDPSQSNPGNFIDQVGNVVGSIFQFIEDLMIMSMGFNRYAVEKSWARDIQLNGKSVVRLNNGSGFMKGGGNRVKKISLSNEWNYGVGTDEYGQQFDYTLEENGRTISSGVAITPQGVGGDESALLSPQDYDLSTPLTSSHNLFVEKPIMKNYYPGPSVGYCKVTVKSLADLSPENIDESYVPITVYEHYTHKDFPTVERETDLSSGTPVQDWAIYPLFGSKMKKHTARSQGYSIELNDMAGKLKSSSQRTFPTSDNPEGTLINRSEYVYHTQDTYSSTAANRLSSEVKIMKANGTMENGVIGQTHDIFHDFHENATKGNQYGADFNLDYWQLGIFPLIAPSFYPSININETSLRTAVTHKVIYKTGLIKEVIITDGLSTITTANVAYDQVTAKPVLTRTTNEFKDYIYSLSEPAHLKYNDPTVGGMAGAYRNLELELNDMVNSTGFMGISGAPNYFVKGDEMWVQYTDGTGEKVFVVYVTGNGIACIREDGSLLSYPGTADFWIIRSGNRNMLTASVGNTTFKGSSGLGSNDVSNLAAKDFHILSTSANTYHSEWDGLACNEYYEPSPIDPCQMNLDLQLLLDAIADPTRGPATGNGMTNTQDLLLHYPSYVTPLIWPTPTGSLLYQVISVTPNELYFSIRPCSNCVPVCDVKLYTNLAVDWSTVSNVYTLFRSDPLDPSEFQIGFVSGTGNGGANRISSPADDCWEFCYIPNVAKPTTDQFALDNPIKTDSDDEETSKRRSSSSLLLGNCDYQMEECPQANTQAISPYLSGLQGVWRPQESYVFKTPRKYEGYTNNEPRLREFGEYETFSPFDWTPGVDNTANGWVKSTETTQYSTYGNVLEEEDALGNYSATQYGYQKQLLVAVGKNMAYREIAFDNFEDYDKDCTDHFRLSGAVKGQNVVTEEAHTGRYSLKVNATDEGPFIVKYLPGDSDPFCQSTFRPVPGERYVLSAWVKETDSGNDISTTTQYENPIIKIQFCDGTPTTLPDIKASGVMIDGWQRIFVDFTVPATAEFFEMRLLNDATDAARVVYFDDLRIHPFDGNMTSYVYDPNNLKFMASLDENNFATFTIRDQKGMAVKLNVETEKGIVTLNEGTRHVKPN